VIVGDRLDEPLPHWSPAIKPRHVGFDAGLVEENEAVRVDPELLERVALDPFDDDIGQGLFGSDECFLKEIFNARSDL